MFGFFKNISHNPKTEYNIYSDTFEKTVALMGFLTMFPLIFYNFLFKESKILVSIFCVTILFSFSMYYIVRERGRHRLVAIIFSLYIVMFLFPAFMQMNNDTKSAIPLFVVAFIMVIFVSVNNKDIIWLVILSFYYLTYTFLKDYLWGERSHVVESPTLYFVGFVFSFTCVAFSIVYIFHAQEKNYARAKEDIIKSHEVIDSMGEAKSRFLASMSNEIRTPMNSLIGMAEVMLSEEMSEEDRNDLLIIKESSYDLLDIIDDVLTYSKLDSGKLKLSIVEMSFDDMMNQILDSIAVMVNQKRIRIRVDLDNDIPKVVLGDDLRIKQIFMRLLFISLQLTDNGRIMISVKSEKTEDGRVKFTCSVSDTGAGLSKADLDAIYEAYDTYDSRQNSNLKGICLKFSICKKLLELMGGEIDIRSISGVGLDTTFCFTLDIVDDTPMVSVADSDKIKALIYVYDDKELTFWKNLMDGFKIRPFYANSYFAFEKAITNTRYDYVFIPKEAYPNVSNVISSYKISEETYVVAGAQDLYGDFDKCRIVRRPISSLNMGKILNGNWKPEDYVQKTRETEYDGKDARILVVDDNSVNLKVASGIFSHYKIDIDMARSGEEALRKLENKNYHLVLMDMVMTGISGIETLKIMRASENRNMRDVPVIALTASTGGNVREEILDQGFQEYLAKPIKTRYLTQCLVKFLPPDVFKKIVRKPEPEKKQSRDLTKEENKLITEKGLANIGYNEDSYCAILNTYYSEGMRKLTDLPGYLENGEISLFTTDVHGIKSSSASIGAMTVSLMFKELEFAGKDKDTDYINAHYEPYKEAFLKILEDVKTYLTDRGKFEYKEAAAEADIIKNMEEEILNMETLKAFKDAVDKMNLKEGDRIMEEMSGKNYGSDNEFFEKIKKAYEMFDFHEVKALLNEKFS
jgi:signal transduction histidine kinase/DNA-binding NarL/FixJ family response regulator